MHSAQRGYSIPAKQRRGPAIGFNRGRWKSTMLGQILTEFLLHELTTPEDSSYLALSLPLLFFCLLRSLPTSAICFYFLPSQHRTGKPRSTNISDLHVRFLFFFLMIHAIKWIAKQRNVLKTHEQTIDDRYATRRNVTDVKNDDDDDLRISSIYVGLCSLPLNVQLSCSEREMSYLFMTCAGNEK